MCVSLQTHYICYSIKSEGFKFAYNVTEGMDRFLCGYNYTFRIPPTSGSSVYNLLQAGVIDNAGAAEKPTPHTRQQKKQRN